MAHFAQLDSNSVVTQVIVVNNVDVMTPQGVEVEQIGIDFCRSLLGADTQWVQTSYNANFRKNYAGIGFTYDSARDAFIPPQPFPSWVLNEETYQWQAPIEMPSDGNYVWDEPTGAWVALVDEAI